ncbi:MAG: preprotein translocase subunit SecG [Oscillospiraceae bacterium]|jgi:preprotein translocase subunit SecG|nr:preprotein translocase subunit SecG [Oscillospiraceae bacterium]
MQAIKVLATVLLVISALIVVISVLMQPGETSGLGAIAGGAETFFGKNKAKSYEGKLALATKVAAGVFLIMSLVIAAIH